MRDFRSVMTRIPRIASRVGMFTVAHGLLSPRVQPQRQEPGHILLLPGIENYRLQFSGTIKGLCEAGICRNIEIVRWGTPPPAWLYNLMALRTNRQRAQTIARRIGELYRRNPEAPITLIGYSGGGGMALLIAEALEPDVKLDRIILVAAAVSPTYDLSAALSHCRRGIVNFYSRNDWFMLGVGTTVFGTIDRKRVVSAGWSGFIRRPGELLECEGLYQIAWENSWLDKYHGGGHLGWLSRPWARSVLAPQIDPSILAEAAMSAACSVVEEESSVSASSVSDAASTFASPAPAAGSPDASSAGPSLTT